ncbi:hypothetical protein P7L87_25290 [Vibrio parahaemolyticus]|nr:hypothetical protein [Vibrio parahaemolyticus]
MKSAIADGRVLYLNVEPTPREYRGAICMVTDAEHIGGITRHEAEASARAIALVPEMVDYVRRCASNCAEANELLKRVEGQS